MRNVVAQTFTDERVPTDGALFVDCDFVRATLLYAGTDEHGFDGCTFTACRWEFVGAAARALAFLKACDIEPGARSIIRATFPNTFRAQE